MSNCLSLLRSENRQSWQVITGLIWLCLFGFMLSITGELYIDSGFSTKIYFTVHLAAIGFLITCLFHPELIRFMKGSYLAMATSLFLLWSGMSGLWSTPSSLQPLGAAIGIAVYIFSIAFLTFHRPDLTKNILLISLSVFAGFLTFGFLDFYTKFSYAARFSQFGLKPMNPLLVGIVTGGLCISASTLALTEKNILLRIFYGILGLLFLLAVIFTQSRTPLVGIIASLIVLTAVRCKNYKIFLTGCAVLLVILSGLAATLGSLTENSSRLLSLDALITVSNRLLSLDALTTVSNRLPIWLNTLEATKEHWLLGVGLGTESVFYGANNFPFEHPHNLYLQALYFTGVIGLTLYIVMYLAAAKTAISTPQKGSLLMVASGMLVYTIVVQASDIHAFVSGPGEYWFLLWSPLGFLIGASNRTNQKIDLNAQRALPPTN